jgi:hypothetical protein
MAEKQKSRLNRKDNAAIGVFSQALNTASAHCAVILISSFTVMSSQHNNFYHILFYKDYGPLACKN